MGEKLTFRYRDVFTGFFDFTNSPEPLSFKYSFRFLFNGILSLPFPPF
jgi:hypothetical protein